MAHVLVVDDEPDIVLLARINLELHGHTVSTAGDGAEALAVLRAAPPDAVILDVMMPQLDGWSVLAALKSDPDQRIRSIPVVMLTALDTEPDQLRGGIEGAVRYLTKPIAPDDLVGTVADVLDGGPEPEQRKAVQQRSLARLARMESGGAGAPEPAGRRVQLSRLERRTGPAGPTAPRVEPSLPLLGEDLTDKQVELLRALRAADSVSEAATSLGTSRSNVYASIRRIGRKLDVQGVADLLHLVRSGDLDPLLGP